MPRTDTPFQDIEATRRELESIAEKYVYNFIHPEVLSVSHKLDQLIVESMRSKPDR